MAKVAPFYYLQQLVYHTNDQCSQAQAFLPRLQRAGTGRKVACLCCRHLNKAKQRGGAQIRPVATASGD